MRPTTFSIASPRASRRSSLPRGPSSERPTGNPVPGPSPAGIVNPGSPALLPGSVLRMKSRNVGRLLASGPCATRKALAECDARHTQLWENRFDREAKCRVRRRLEIDVKPTPGVLFAPLAKRVALRGHLESPSQGRAGALVPHVCNLRTRKLLSAVRGTPRSETCAPARNVTRLTLATGEIDDNASGPAR